MPTLITSNVAFIVDTSVLDDNEDLNSDDMGTWKNNRVDKSYVSVTIDDTEVTEVDKCHRSSKRGVFLVKRVYRVHGTDRSLRKITTTIYGMLTCCNIILECTLCMHQACCNCNSNSND